MTTVEVVCYKYKQRTADEPQNKKERERKGKNGKIAKIAGCSPIREGVLLVRSDTTLADVRKFGEECQRRWGITPLQVFIHRDEGHYAIPGDTATWKPNLHAHIVWDWMNHDTGKSCKLNVKDMSEMQTVLAECLEMERGTSKKLTGKEHLERTDFIIAKQKQEAEQAQAEKEAALSAKEKAEAERVLIENENKVKEERNAVLDGEIADKEKQRDEIRKGKVDSILDSVSSLVGVGKTASLEKEYRQVKEENARLKNAFQPAVSKAVEELTLALVAEKQKVEAERDRLLVQNHTLTIERNKAIARLNSQQADEQQRIENAVKLANAEKDKTIRVWQNAWKTNREVLNILADMLYAISEFFKRAIDAIIHYGTEKYKSIFDNDEAAAIKSVMQNYGKSTKQQQAIGSWLCDYAQSRQPFDEIKHRQTRNEVADVANGAYDWKFEQGAERGHATIINLKAPNRCPLSTKQKANLDMVFLT